MEECKGVIVNRDAACGLSEDSDSRGVACERSDVRANPFECEALIKEAKVLSCPGCPWETKNIGTIAENVLRSRVQRRARLDELT
jgi:hypothetical protein